MLDKTSVASPNIVLWNIKFYVVFAISPYKSNLDSGIQETVCLWNPESTKYLFVESGIILFGILNPGLGVGIQNAKSGIRNPLRWNLESSTWDLESTSWNPESTEVESWIQV